MAISFASGVKAEICRSFPQKTCCAIAQCLGVFLFGNSFTPRGIRIVTESREFGELLPRLLKKAFSLEFDQKPQGEESGKLVFSITDPEKIQRIFNTFGFQPESTLSVHINLPVVEEDCCRGAFLRGAFLAGGSVTDPEKGYHLELTTTHQSVAGEAFALCREVGDFSLKIAGRAGGKVLYMKQSDRISDFLAYLGAPVSAMQIIEAKLEKELTNRVNRRCNCDDANTSKVVEAAQEQLSAIRRLRDSGAFSKLPPKLLQAAQARLDHPESSLTELASMMEPPITKPAMNHRLKKLVEISREGMQ